MSQMQWVLCAERGQRHQVGIYHGDKTGHVLIYCNDEIVTIDFGVLKNKTYTFYIDNELCTLSLEKEVQGFTYGFKIDEKTLTPRNLERHKQDVRDARKLLIWIGGFFFLIILMIVFFLVIGG